MSEGNSRVDPAEPLVRIEGLRKQFAKRSLLDRLAGRPESKTLALDDVTFSVAPREALALVGESGSGKTTLAHILVGLIKPDAGQVEFDGRDILRISRRELPAVRRRMQLIYQDPYSSLNSALKIGDAIIEPALVHGLIDKQDAEKRTVELMDQVGLSPSLASRRPEALSGGQRQRVAIARSLAAEPDVLIADEAISALDVSVQVQVIGLFARLQQELGLTLIFVSHQLATVAQLCERVAILYRGRLVEIGPVSEIFRRPRHGYTASLIQAHPGHRRLRDRPDVLMSSSSAPSLEQEGCPFRHRCAYVREICHEVTPASTWVTREHMARCHVLPNDPKLAAGAGIEMRLEANG